MEPGALVEVRVHRSRWKERVEVVTGDDDAILRDRDPRRPLADRDPKVRSFLRAEQPGQAVVVCPPQIARIGVEQVEDGTLTPHEAARELDHLLEDLRRIAQRGDPRGQFAQRLLGGSSPGGLVRDRSSSSRERSSSSISRALAMALAA
jgi:hypothetical protein